MTLEFILKLIERYELESNQAIYLALVYEGDTASLVRYCAKVKDSKELVPRIVDGKRKRISKQSRLTESEAVELKEKGLIENGWEYDQEFNLLDVRLSPTFIEWMDKELGRKDYGNANEFWNAYPSANHSNGKAIPLKGVNVEEFKDRYSREVSKEMHKKLMQILTSNKSNINVRIDNFVFGKEGSEPQWPAFASSPMSALGGSNLKL